MIDIKALTHNDLLWCKVSSYAENCSWKAGAMLSKLMNNNDFSDWERVFVAFSGDDIAGYCTLSKTDCIPDVPYTPYVSFLFVDELFRGKRISEMLCSHATQYAKTNGFENVYLVSDHINLYEKYGFTKIDEKLAPWGAMQTIFICST